jgi:uncharacterized protein YbjT (DUF2867 family)
MSSYVVTGATGHTGRPIALGLLAAGHAVRIVSRSADKAKELTAKGAVLFTGDARDAGLLAQAMNEGRILSAHTRDAEATTPTTLEDFAPAFKAVYVSQGGAVA